MLHRVWVHLGSFRNYMKLGAKRGELVQLMQKFVPRIHVVIFHNERTDRPHWTINSCFGVFLSVCVHLESLRNCMKLDGKWGELVQKFVPQIHLVIFHNERT